MNSKKGKPGPAPQELRVAGDWRNAVKKALKKKRPKEGWPKEKQPTAK